MSSQPGRRTRILVWVLTVAVAALGLTVAGLETRVAVGVAPGSLSTLPPVHVVGLGDSVMAGTACDCAGIPASYARLLEERTGRSVSWANRGVSGATAGDLLDDLRHSDSLRTAIGQADVVVVTIGPNDMVAALEASDETGGGTSARAAAAAALSVRMDAILQTLRAVHAGRPFVCLVLGTWNVFAEGDPDVPTDDEGVSLAETATADVNQTLKAAAARAGDQFVDLLPAFRRAGGDQEDSPLLAEDGDHPNAEFVRIIAAELMRAYPGQ